MSLQKLEDYHTKKKQTKYWLQNIIKSFQGNDINWTWNGITTDF